MVKRHTKNTNKKIKVYEPDNVYNFKKIKRTEVPQGLRSIKHLHSFTVKLFKEIGSIEVDEAFELDLSKYGAVDRKIICRFRTRAKTAINRHRRVCKKLDYIKRFKIVFRNPLMYIIRLPNKELGK